MECYEKQKNRFQVGDEVIASSLSAYYITKPGWTGVVTGVLGGGIIEVRSKHEDIGTFKVDSRVFDHYPRSRISASDEANKETGGRPVEREYAIDYGWASGWAHKKKITSPKKSFMSKISTMFKKLLDTDTQALVEAGYLDETLELTDLGGSQLKAIMFEHNKEALVSLAKARLAEMKK